MSIYELTLVFPEEKDGKSKKAVMKMIEDYISKHKGKVVKHESWGIKKLAFPIKKQESGDYEHYVFELEPNNQQELEKSVRLEESLLRFLFISV